MYKAKHKWEDVNSNTHIHEGKNRIPMRIPSHTLYYYECENRMRYALQSN